MNLKYNINNNVNIEFDKRINSLNLFFKRFIT